MPLGSQTELFKQQKRIRSEAAFMTWLERDVGFGRRSAADVVSRVKRAMGFADVLAPVSDHELVFRLQESREYRECSASVRSQLKRAARLYREFRTVLAS